MKIGEVVEKVLTDPKTPYIVITIALAIYLSPMAWTIISALKTTEEIFAWPPTIIPEKLTLNNFVRVINSPIVTVFMKNSLVIACLTTSIVTVVGTFTAYGLSQFRFKGSNTFLFTIVLTRLIPPISMIVPFYIIASQLRLINTLTILIIVNIYLWLPFVVWTLKSTFDEFPSELVDSARVDGCSRVGILFRIAMPVLATTIGAVAIVTFMWTWNEFIFALILINTSDLRVITSGLFWFVGDEMILWHEMSAAALLAALPSIVFFILTYKYILRGLLTGGMKF